MEEKNPKLEEALEIAKAALRHCERRHLKCNCSREALMEIEDILNSSTSDAAAKAPVVVKREVRRRFLAVVRDKLKTLALPRP